MNIIRDGVNDGRCRRNHGGHPTAVDLVPSRDGRRVAVNGSVDTRQIRHRVVHEVLLLWARGQVGHNGLSLIVVGR